MKRATVKFPTPQGRHSASERQQSTISSTSTQRRRTSSSPGQPEMTQKPKTVPTNIHFRNAAKKVIAQRRLSVPLSEPENPPGVEKSGPVPFSAASPYPRVREVLDPVKHRHLMGDHLGAVQMKSGPTLKIGATAAKGGRTPRAKRLSLTNTGPHESEEDEAESRLPTGAEVLALPEEMRVTFYSVATDNLRRLFYPRVCFKIYSRQKRHLRDQAHNHAIRLNAEAIKAKNKFFADWNVEALHTLLSGAVYQHYEPGEILFHELEPPHGSGIVFLSAGTCQLLRRKDRFRDKRLRDGSVQHVATVYSPTAFGSTSFMAKEPRLNAVKATGRCDCWLVTHEAFARCLALLPPETIQAMEAKAHAKRVQTLPLLYPLNVSVMREYPLFERSSSEFLEALMARMQPLAVASHYTLCREGEPISHMLVVRFGKIKVYRNIAGAETHIKTIRGASLLNGEGMLHGSGSTDTLVTADGCDLYTLAAEAFEQVMGLPQFAEERLALIAESRSKHMRQLSTAQIQFRPLIYQIPIVKDLLSVEQLNSLSYLFEGKIYSQLSLVASASDMCDRLVIVTKGKVSLGKRGIWHKGESSGFTCIVPHRWLCAGVALEPVECIELAAPLLTAFLRDCNVYSAYKRIVMGLLFPDVPKPLPKAKMVVARQTLDSAPDVVPEELELFQRFCSHQSTPAMFPVSIRGASLSSQGFTPTTSSSGASSAFAMRMDTGLESIIKGTPPLTSGSGQGKKNGAASGAEPMDPAKREKVADFAHLLPKSLPLLAGGKSSKLNADEKRKIAAQVVAEFDPVHQRRLTQVTSYLWVKQKSH